MAPLVPALERSLGPEVVANRAGWWGRASWRLAPWAPARAAWSGRLAAAIERATPGTTFAVADVRSCYPSITPAAIGRAFGPRADRVVALLERFADDGVRGLPIGPDPSAVVANGVLARLDEAVRGAGVEHLRWVDDLVLWGSRGDVVRALTAAHRTALGLGLALHDAKTRILDDPDELSSNRASIGRGDR